MDFDKLNNMLDELNKNFDIVKENTKRIEEEKLDAKKKLFYSTLEYFANWGQLFQKCGSPCIKIKTNESNEHPISMYIEESRHHIGTICFGRTGYVESFLMRDYNPVWANWNFFPAKSFESEILPTIKSIDYNYIERVLSEELNEVITKKAEEIEAAYNKAMQDA